MSFENFSGMVVAVGDWIEGKVRVVILYSIVVIAHQTVKEEVVVVGH